MRVGERNDLTDVAGVAVGHHQRTDPGWLTGVTVVVPPAGTVGGADVRGGGPGTRETDALGPTTLVSEVDAVCLTGGSAYGLASAEGVMAWLEAQNRGFRVGPEAAHVVPIVPAAVLFDLGAGGAFTHRPDASFGAAAAAAAGTGRVAQGTVGAGTGAHAGRLKGGIGSASAITATGVTVAALVALNSGGSVVDERTGELWGARLGLSDEFTGLRRPSTEELDAYVGADDQPAPSNDQPAPSNDESVPLNTTLAVVATDARLSKPECVRMAGAAHDGMARAISPVHRYTDGDVAFGLATGSVRLSDVGDVDHLRSGTGRFAQLGDVLSVAADAVSRAVVHATLHATSAGAMVSYADQFPSGLGPGRG